MGTSSNSTGSKGKSPLIPPHADSEPGKPVPERPEGGLANFRRSLTDFMKSGGSTLRDRALHRYARGAVGGPSTGTRRFGSVAVGGAVALGALSELAQGGDGSATSGRDISGAIGAPIDVAAQIIAEAVAPQGAEGDRVRILIQEAICEVLEEASEDALTAEAITPEFLSNVMFNYIVEAILHDILYTEGSPSLDAAESAQTLQDRENDLREAVSAVVDGYLTNNPQYADLSSTTNEQRRQLQLDCIRSVLDVWDANEQ